jgi:phage-related baseplate assembly protein
MVVLSDHLLRSQRPHGTDEADVPLATRLEHLLAGTKIILSQPAPAEEPAPIRRQVQRRLTPAEQVAVAQAYQAGADMKDLAAAYRVHRHSISHCLHALAIPLRRQGLQEQDLEEAARLYLEGWSLARLGQHYGCHLTHVHQKLIAHGVQMRPRPGWKY